MRKENTHTRLKKRFGELQESNTRTAARVLFLRELLELGMSKREAAHMLAEVDAQLGRNSAETIVYTNFSGEYKTIRRRTLSAVDIPKVDTPSDVEDDEGLL